MTAITLRYYQQEAVDAIYGHFSTHASNPIVALPTAAGKSIVIAAFIKRALADYPKTRIIKITHRKELIAQNFAKLMTMWPAAPAGVYSAGLNRREIGAQVLFAGIQSLAHVDPDVVGHTDILLIDECHLVPFAPGTQYRVVIDALLNINPNLKVVGFTATPYRLDSGLLIESGVFESICYDRCSAEHFNQLVDDGFLCRLVTKATQTDIDVSDVHKRGGEFIPAELEEAVDKRHITTAAVDEVIKFGQHRKAWLLFATSIRHAEHINDYLLAQGVESAVLHSKIETDRDVMINDFKSGKLRALVNVDILTTGFDHPAIDLIAMLRPTLSPVLHVQTIGRGLRIDPGKKDCLVLDFAGNTMRLGPINNVQVASKKKGGTGSPREATGVRMPKECEECHSIVDAAEIICPDCGTEFPSGISHEASQQPVVYVGGASGSFPVVDVKYRLHKKEGKPDSLRIDYFLGMRTVSEWVCFDHPGGAGKRALRWWKKHGYTKEQLESLRLDEESLLVPMVLSNTEILPTPNKILVGKLHQQYPDVIDYIFEE